MWEWLINQMPWYVQAGLLALVVGVPVYLVACMIFGVKTATRTVLGPLVGVIALLGLASKLRQEGYKARVDQEEKARDEAESYVDDKRLDVERLPDDHLDNRFNRWEN